MLIEAVLRLPPWPVGHAQCRTFVEIIKSDESLHHQLTCQDRVNFWGAQTPISVLLCTLSRFKSFETMDMNFFNYYRLEQYLQNNMPVLKINFGQIVSPSLQHDQKYKVNARQTK